MKLIEFILDKFSKLLDSIKFKKISLVFRFRKKTDKNKNRSYTFSFEINKSNF
ncbi:MULTISPECIES: hypothetical protein [unclassified Gilliamella]|uniref:hypothetical protein n=1 Tax=unclassified Gilliamella TaxID=2685620 RepID=UPI00226A284B|nr:MULTISPECIES: hypothetical protein [unclassified Gilliamella]MCX8587986.1 hypothetical protein [Gilliamella sp. B3801]MCX8592425.1 hypothetical protein [Gilliamella sp. B3804]